MGRSASGQEADFGWLATCPIARQARTRPNRLAITEFLTGRRLTYRQFDDAIARTAAWMRRIAPSEGGRVAVLGRNNLEQVLLFYAAQRARRVFVPMNWRLSGDELAIVAEDCRPEALIYQPEFAPAATRALEACPDATVFVSPPEAAAVWSAIEDEGPYDAPVDPFAVATLLYTSGTTGRPKGVMVTRKTAVFSAYNWTQLAEMDSRSAMILDAPLFHVIGLLAILAGTLLAGGVVHVSDRFEPAATLERLEDEALGVTHYFGVPQMAQALADLPEFATARLPSLRALVSGGAPLAPSLIEAYLSRGLPLVNGYGMTEAGSVVGAPLDIEAIRTHMGCVGFPSPAMELRIVDPEGRPLPPGEAGEIWLRSPSLSPGYWTRPEATEQAFQDGWLRTGDAGCIDADGWVRLLDRYKDMYITGGENVYPAEVETALAELPEVAEVAVVGVPDARWGEAGVAYVVLREGMRLSAQEVIDFCGTRLARYKRPAEVRFIDSLPHTGSGKVAKDALRVLHAKETEKSTG